MCDNKGLKTVYLTGYSGFLGRAVLELLLKSGCSVVLLGRKNIDLKNTKFKKIDIENRESLKKVFEKDSSILVHLAAKIPNAKPESREEFLKTNLMGTINISEEAIAAGIKKIIFASTWDIYGYSQPKKEIDENCIPNPENYYSMSKLSAEKYLSERTRSADISVKILRFSNLYGPAPSQNGALMNFITNISNGSKINIAGGGLQERDYLYISDAARAVLLAVGDGGKEEVFNIGYGKPVSIKNLAETISLIYEKFGISCSGIEYGNNKGNHSRYLNISRARKELAYEPLISLDEGITKTIMWYEKSLRKRKPKIVVFDIDGTILNVNKRYTETMEMALAKYGFNVASKISKVLEMRRSGMSGKQIIKEFTNTDDPIVERIDKLRKELLNEDSFLRKDTLLHGIIETMGDIKQSGYKMVGLTFRKNVARDLKNCGVSNYFDRIICKDKKTSSKKTEELIKIAKAYNVSTFELLVVGDTEDDILAGGEVGSKTVGVLTGLSSYERLKYFGSDYIINNLTELKRIIVNKQY